MKTMDELKISSNPRERMLYAQVLKEAIQDGENYIKLMCQGNGLSPEVEDRMTKLGLKIPEDKTEINVKLLKNIARMKKDLEEFIMYPKLKQATNPNVVAEDILQQAQEQGLF